MEYWKQTKTLLLQKLVYPRPLECKKDFSSALLVELEFGLLKSEYSY